MYDVGRTMPVAQTDMTNENRFVTLGGTVENVIFRNDENGYTVFDMSVDEANDETGSEIVTACGIVPDTSVGERLVITGEWTVTKNWGRQFRIAYFQKSLPSSENEILRYLSGRAVKGIGPKTAQRIVDKFGSDTFDVLENHPEWLESISGINASKAREISESFRQQSGVRELMMLCREYLTSSMSMKIYKKWGASSVDIIQHNPYRLCEDFDGIGFEKADRLARFLGVGDDSPFRLMSGIRYVLSEASRSGGHAFLPRQKLISAASQTLGVDIHKTDDAVRQLIDEKKLVSVKLGNIDAVYDAISMNVERDIERKLELIDKVCPGLDAGDVERLITRIELEEDKQYAPMQKRAITDALCGGVMVLTGGPGTGKTTVIRALIRLFGELGLKVALAAPTGRAAKRMSEATQCEAKTIHRLLETEFSDADGESGVRDRFRKNENDLLSEDVVIIDEASMIDMYLCDSLLKAIKPGARLVLIGDSDQLPSVGAGNVLCDIIASERFRVVRLCEVFRQASESLIITNAHRINNGEYPVLNSTTGDFFFLARSTDDEISDTISDLCARRLPKTYGEKAAEGIQVISPSRRGAAGTETLNRVLQQSLNPPARRRREKKFRDIVFREGDRVMQIKNDYDLSWERDGESGSGVFNGDIGKIETINDGAEEMIITFDDRTVIYDYSKLDELDLAYAITVHKSQGSEYPFVIIPMYRSCPKQLLTRNLLYTAVTRARRMVIMVGSPQVVAEMVDNNRQVMRYTGLFKLADK